MFSLFLLFFYVVYIYIIYWKKSEEAVNFSFGFFLWGEKIARSVCCSSVQKN